MSQMPNSSSLYPLTSNQNSDIDHLSQTNSSKSSCVYPFNLSQSAMIEESSELPTSIFVGAPDISAVSMKPKISKYDRYIPCRVNKGNLIIREEKVSQKETENYHNNLHELYEQYVMNTQQPSPVKGITSFQNRNILRFGKEIENTDSSKPWLAGLEIQDSLVHFKNKQRKVKKVPFKVLDAPALQDDYYLNLIDWSPHDYLAVGLATSAYLWNSRNSQVTKLCDLGLRNFATAVGCSRKNPLIALGTQSGVVQVWDVEKLTRLRSFGGHTERVAAVAWGGSLLSTGSRDKSILHRDLRCSEPYISRLVSHNQEVCGLKWSYDQQQLCSGGNDNRLLIWSIHSDKPQHQYNDHLAAVKAVSWSPHQHGLLASGGGTADRTIKFRNTLTGETISSWQTGSQVCNIAFSQSLNELVSTHGYSQNEVAVWDCSEMKKVASLKGHTYRVLYLAMSPDGSTVVTGAGDETLRFWQLFPSNSQSFLYDCQLDDCLPNVR